MFLKNKNTPLIAAIVIALSLMLGLSIVKNVEAQTRNNAINQDKFGKVIQEIGSQVTYTPTELGLNAVTLPISSTTGLSAKIDLAGAKEITIFATCGQIFDIRVAVLAEDNTTVLQTLAVVTAVPAAGGFLTVGSEAPANVTAGTLAIAGLRTPLRGVQLQFNNTTANASTCTARALVQY